LAGGVVYYRPGVAGSFAVTASARAPQTPVSSYSFPALGTGWSGSQAGATDTYSFTSSAVDPSEPNNASATNAAGVAGSNGSFTVDPDGALPGSEANRATGAKAPKYGGAPVRGTRGDGHDTGVGLVATTRAV